MAFEHIDIQWTVVSSSSLREALDSMDECVQTAGWSVIKRQVKDRDDTLLSSEETWPSETLGSAEYSKGDDPTRYALFWSTYTQKNLTKITGGLYLCQYARTDPSLIRACNRALEDIRTLFGGNDVLCIVLTLEDDDGIDIGSGIIGSYRSSLWQRMSSTPLPGLVQEARPPDWIDVFPSKTDDEMFLSIFSMQTILARRF